MVIINTILLLMLKSRLSIFLLVAVSIAPFPLIAGPLTRAEVTKIINQVSVVDPQIGGRPAALKDVIKDDLGVETGKKSRSELLFQDDTLTRLGAETFYSFKTGTRDMSLEKGSMLLQVPKGLGGAKIHTAAVTAAITGTTIMMEYIPQQYIKVLVLEGSLRLSLNRRLGDSLVLRPGKMVIMRPDAKKIPDPVDVDLQQIANTSTLVNFPGSAPLPSMPLIQSAIDVQQGSLAKKDLIPTNLALTHGTKVFVSPTIALTTPTTTGGSPVATVKGTAPLLGGVVSTVSGTTAATTSTANTLVASTTYTVGSLATNLLGSASTIASVPLTGTVDSVIGATADTVSALVNNIGGTVSTVTAIPVASTAQVLSLLDSAVGGVVSVSPTSTSLTSAVTAPTTLVSNTTTAVANTAPTLLSSATSTSTTPVTSSTAPVLSSLTTTTALVPPSTLTPIPSVPTTLVSTPFASATSLLGR